MGALRSIAPLVALAVGASGCLGDTYHIPAHDLEVLARTPPEQRGEHVRVVQQFAGADEPPDATPVHAGAEVVVVTPVQPRHRRTRSVSNGGHVAKTSRLAGAAKEESKFWIVLAAIGAVGLAVTEGARFDGWVRLHPMHPVHLFGPYGEYAVVPLAQIDPATAAWAERAVIVEDEGPFEPLERAPLDRVGLTYSLLMGVAEQPSADGTEGRGFMSHIQFGVFPTQQIGLQLDIGFGFRDNQVGGTIFDGRYALELDFLPLDVGKLHAGVFGEGGAGVRLEDGVDGGDRQGFLFAGGAIGQLELTTRLALTVRAQATRFFETTVSDVGVGLSIY